MNPDTTNSSAHNEPKFCPCCGGFVSGIYAGNPAFCRCNQHDELKRELAEKTAEVERLRELLRETQDFLYDLRGEWDWRKEEPRCGYKKQYERLGEVIEEIDKLAPAPEEPSPDKNTELNTDKNAEQPVSNSEWRELGPDEVIQEGDEYFSMSEEWRPVKLSLGQKVSDSALGIVRTRRPLPKREEEPKTYYISVPCKICGKDSGSGFNSNNPLELRSNDATCPNCVKIFRGFPDEMEKEEMPLEGEIFRLQKVGWLNYSEGRQDLRYCLRYLRDEIEKIKEQLKTIPQS